MGSPAGPLFLEYPLLTHQQILPLPPLQMHFSISPKGTCLRGAILSHLLADPPASVLPSVLYAAPMTIRKHESRVRRVLRTLQAFSPGRDGNPLPSLGQQGPPSGPWPAFSPVSPLCLLVTALATLASLGCRMTLPSEHACLWAFANALPSA